MIKLEHLQHLHGNADGREWLESLPAMLAKIEAQWQLKLEPQPYLNGTASYVVPAHQDEKPVVLKLQWPHEECLYEADALIQWNGKGAVRLLEHDQALNAMLLERCEPGVNLSKSNEQDKLGVVISLLPKIWIDTHGPFKSLELEARHWQAHLYKNWANAGKPVSQTVVEQVNKYIDELLATPTRHVLVHQDMHGDNILSSCREPWLVIDPKPLLGEREFSVASVIRSTELGHSHSEVLDRLNRLCQSLALNRERTRKWAIVQTLCWSFDGGSHSHMFDVVNWLMAEESSC